MVELNGKNVRFTKKSLVGLTLDIKILSGTKKSVILTYLVSRPLIRIMLNVICLLKSYILSYNLNKNFCLMLSDAEQSRLNPKGR